MSAITENKLNAVLESTPDPFIIVGGDGTIERVNRQSEILFGYTRRELVGKSYKMLIPERFRAQHDVFSRDYREDPVMRRMGEGLELWCLTKSGQEVPVDIGLSPVMTGDDTSIMVRFRDIRREKEEQKKLNMALEKAGEANRIKTRFLAAASHDLRQPLQSISMYLGVLESDPPPGERKRVINQARMSVDTTNKLLNALLNITKLESGHVQPEIEHFIVSDLLERVFNTERPAAAEKNQKFSMVPSRAVVTSDPALLEQLVNNLVANAIKYTPPGGHILLGCRRQESFLKIEVADNGPGIATEELDVIFDEYRQLDYTDPQAGKGLGLGLSIVKLIAELLNLKLEVKSIPGRGASFSVYVPLSSGKPRVKTETPTNLPKPEAMTGTLLLVDDDPAVLDSTAMFLEISGFTVIPALNADEAVAAVKRQAPDIIVTDYGLATTLNGIELLAEIRQLLDRPVPGIVVTGDMSEQRGQEAGTADCEILHKPIDGQKLLELARQLLAAG